MNPDLAARKVIVAAYLYYVLDSNPAMSDHEYDELSQFVADNWDQLHPTRQWQLGDPASTRAGGSHIKFTALAVSAARQLYSQLNKRNSTFPYPEVWKQREDGLRYVTAV